MISIDWLTIRQEHPNLPDLSDEVVMRLDTITGEVIRRTGTGRQVVGSHDSSMRLRVQNGWLELSGNPSKWNREDSIHGISDINDAIDVFQAILAQENLPAFSFDERTYPTTINCIRSEKNFIASAPGSERPATEGAAISRIDLCENYACGKDAPRVIRWLASHCYRGKPGQVIGDSETVSWGRNRRRYIKYYRKAPELKEHATPSDYIDELSAWATDAGIIRHEVSLLSNTLREAGLHKPGKWTYEEMEAQMEKVRIHRHVEMATGSWHRIAEDLEAAGHKRLVANNAHAIAQAWLNGSLDKDRYNKRTWNRYRNVLLAVGIDINQPMVATRLPVKAALLNMKPLRVDDIPERFRRKA